MLLTEDAVYIFQQAIAAVQPAVLLQSKLEVKSGVLYVEELPFRLHPNGKIYVLAAGKAAAAMALATETIVGKMLSGGIVVTKYGHGLPLQNMQLIEAGHPLPDAQSLIAAQAIIHFAQQLTEQDVVLFLLSGGASALLADTPPGIALFELQQTFQLLLASGATIQEMNTLRKHLSAIKGGQLARLLMPASVITFAISDVIGDDPSIIGSGPTFPDTTTFADAWTVVLKYHLQHRIPNSVIQHLQKGLNGMIADTPKNDDSCFKKTHYFLLGSNGTALQSAKNTAEKLGYHTTIVTRHLTGEAKEVGVAIVQQAIGYNGPRPGCLLFGGETTVTIQGKGLGGRNQELALSAALALPEHSNLVILSGGTDGTDGPTDAAGAYTNIEQMQQAIQLGINATEYLQQNDSYHFFEVVNGLIKTGPTQTNVMDLVIVLIT
ncbi:MAG: DUF4147 domain-containing protein [Hydrotalea flava]|nr:DUF4147 domain-containing protein [Hydrotalea flava]NIM38598.1 DUF4147 domain-containing protein [Hydrotalea flava]NIN03782.1 DUF4147 domain-containing protein [Hydrotalea flava]NIN15476.1 DUF4147 domain-containing protein [Hydrotalea flava]NIO94524.1 DUF4147 domain-containing protein [Hydrotalea flava]